MRRLTLLLVLAVGCGPAPPPGPLSVLLVSIDTLRPDYLGLNGYALPTSPFLDELLGSGFYFERAVTPIARTTPALASLLTGAYPHRTGVRTLNGTLSPDVVSLAEVLRDAGYQTLAIVSNTVLTPERRLGRGFDVYDASSNLRIADATSRRALYYLETVDASRPFFAWIHYIDPHVPYHPEASIAESFDPDYRGRYRLHFGHQPGEGDTRHSFRAWPEDLPKQIATHANPLSERENEHVRRLYAGEIRRTDDALPAVVAAARARAPGRLLIVVTADHGESLGEHDFYFDHGDYVYNPGTRVPLGFVLPEGHPLAGSGRCPEWVSLADVAPTLLELLQVELDAARAAQLEGRSLVPCLRGERLPPQPVFAESGRSWYPERVKRRVRNDVAGRFRAVTLGDWKLIWTPFREEADAWELYHLRDDPGETRDLHAPGHAEAAGLRQALRGWLDRAPADEAPPPPLTSEDREALRELGYVP